MSSATNFNPNVDPFDPERVGFKKVGGEFMQLYKSGQFEVSVDDPNDVVIWKIGDDELAARDQPLTHTQALTILRANGWEG